MGSPLQSCQPQAWPELACQIETFQNLADILWLCACIGSIKPTVAAQKLCQDLSNLQPWRIRGIPPSSCVLEGCDDKPLLGAGAKSLRVVSFRAVWSPAWEFLLCRNWMLPLLIVRFWSVIGSDP